MIDPDDRGRAAARALLDHVASTADTDRALAEVEAVTPRRGRSGALGRLLVVAASLALIAGTVAVLSSGTDGGRERDGERIDADEALPEPAALVPLGPRDGRSSLGLPVTLDPAGPLEAGQQVAVRGEGFVAGESVGVVQCGIEAGAIDQGGLALGVTACNIGRYEQATADDAGVVNATFVVERSLTTPGTGTIDCAERPERCLVAVGALNDYDRSGGATFELTGELPPLDLPTLAAQPAENLADGHEVRVVGSGLSGRVLGLEQCSIDPDTCWPVGEPIGESDTSGACDPALGCMYEGYVGTGAHIADDGSVDATVTVWRYLPGQQPGTFVDCAVSACTMRATSVDGPASPPPVLLGFAGTEPPPVGAALSVSRSTGLAAGDRVTISGAGFPPGVELHPGLCLIGPDDDPGFSWFCWPVTDGPVRTADDGSFAVGATIPETDETWLECFGVSCEEQHERRVGCSVPQTVCELRIDSWRAQASGRAPWFGPAPVQVTFRD